MTHSKSEIIARYRRLERHILADTNPRELACHILELRQLKGGL